MYEIRRTCMDDDVDDHPVVITARTAQNHSSASHVRVAFALHYLGMGKIGNTRLTENRNVHVIF